MSFNSDFFDLTGWKLTLPVDSSGGISGSAYEIRQLVGYELAYFYDAPDHAMVFRAPAEGATTGGSNYARAELREMKEGQLAAWTAAEGGSMTAALRVDQVPTKTDGTTGRVIVSQIHGEDDELLRLYWDNGSVYFINDHAGSGNGETKFVPVNAGGQTASISLGENFSYKISLSGNSLDVEIYADGAVYSSKTIINSVWMSDELYFKAGLYLGVNENNSSGIGQVSFYTLHYQHDANETLLGGVGDDFLQGHGGNDLADGGAGNDTISGGGGDDILIGGTGGDNISGGAGADRISGGADPDVIWGDDGADLISGDGGNDQLQGFAGNDTIWGGEGGDLIAGGGGADILQGNAGNDVIWGDSPSGTVGSQDLISGDDGADILNGYAGNDIIWGGAGGDSISGGTGSDVLRGDAGNDYLDGGADADYFQYGARGFGQDQIFHFTHQDRIQISSTIFASSAAALASSAVSGGNTFINAGNGDIIVLIGFTDLTQSDILVF